MVLSTGRPQDTVENNEGWEALWQAPPTPHSFVCAAHFKGGPR